VLAAFLVLALLEGIASLVYVGRDVAAKTKWRIFEPDRELVTRFDPDLGWCANPGRHVLNRADHSAEENVDAQGFRGTREFAREVPPGKVRALASGDSFTFGTGVADDQTWCEGLARHEPRLETVNLGVGGYGIDQAYLRYCRDGARLDHDLHLFAFITEDVLRAVIPASSAEKPRLVIEADELRVLDVPVRRRSAWERTFRQAGGVVSELRLVQGARYLAGQRERPNLSEDDEARALAIAIFEHLARLAKERGCELVLVHLPVEDERSGGSVDVLRLFFETEARRLGIGWIDLLDDFRALSSEEHASLYLRRPSPGTGHYNPKGHEFVADLIARRLREIPTVSARLDGRP
jgi:hypothetical protein